MIKKITIHFFCIVLLSLFLVNQSGRAEMNGVGYSIPLPNLNFRQNLSKGEQAYLGIPRKARFSFNEIQGSLIVVEIINTSCLGCQKQTPIFNELYSLIEINPQLRGRVKVIGIAAGNNKEEVDTFKEGYNILYPIIADPKFDAHTPVGSPRTPFTIWVRKDPQGKGIVVGTYLGLMDSAKGLLDEVRTSLQYELPLLKTKKGMIYEGDTLKPILTEEELITKAKEGMEVSGGKVLQIEKIYLKDWDWVYMGRVDFGKRERTFFSKLASRRAICDNSQDTFFIYTFDSAGKVIEIVPVQLTKNDNLKWTEEDINQLKGLIVGRSITKPFQFDPKGDSHSGTTLSAVLIFDSLNKAREIYEKLKSEGLIKK